jgi:hypothetical protein
MASKIELVCVEIVMVGRTMLVHMAASEAEKLLKWAETYPIEDSVIVMTRFLDKEKKPYSVGKADKLIIGFENFCCAMIRSHVIYALERDSSERDNEQ